ncbi:MAG: hypothetical protein Kow0026_25480 [Oricola sp.]
MSVFASFRVRNRLRDRSTDEDRFESLLQHVRKLGDAAQRELGGLKTRYEQAGADAAFACLAEENEGPSEGGSERIGALTETIMNYADRVKYLERQIAYFEQLERDIAAAAEDVMHPVSRTAETLDS